MGLLLQNLFDGLFALITAFVDGILALFGVTP